MCVKLKMTKFSLYFLRNLPQFTIFHFLK